MQANNTGNTQIEYDKIIAKLFLFFIPFSIFKPFAFLRSIFVGVAGRASFVFLIVGLLLYVIQNGARYIEPDEGGLLLRHFAVMYIVVDIVSVLMAIILSGELGTIGGEGTIEATFKKALISVAIVAIMFYVREIFCLLTKEEIVGVLDKVIDVCIVLGFLQIAVLKFGSIFSTIYDFINVAFGAWSSSAIISTERIALLTSEPATIAGFFGVMLFPYLFSKWIHFGLTSGVFIRLVLLVFIMYFSKSTTGYTLFCVDVIVFAMLYLIKKDSSIAQKAGAIMMMFIIAILIVHFIGQNQTINKNMAKVFDKLINDDNTSSAVRKIGLQVNWNIFKRFPFTGVGNGNQGFYYREFFPQSALVTPLAVKRYNQAANQLMDGGVYFASFMSGYGIIGILFMVTFIVRGVRLITRERGRFGGFYYFYLIAIVSLIVYGFSSTLIGDFSTWFIFGLPMAASFWQTDETETLPIHTSKYSRS